MATRKCPICKGRGHDYFYNQYHLRVPCPTCRGTGKQHQEKKWVAGDE